MTTNVPQPQFTPTGLVVPDESAILDGVLQDWDDAFGGGMNKGLSTPQGQLATSQTAVIADKNDQLLQVTAQVDPNFASGRWQDAIGAIYFITRKPAQASVVQCTCTGLPSTGIPVGALATDGVNIWVCTQAGVIPIGGSVVLEFACATDGPVACPANSVNQIYQSVNGWESVNNSSDGVVGSDVESRREFEQRRQDSVAGNSRTLVQSVRGAVLGLPGVLDCYAVQNDNGYPVSSSPAAQITGAISGTTLTVATTVFGVPGAGQLVSLAANNVAGVALPDGLTIVSGSGPYTLSAAATVPPGTTINLGGVQLRANSLYICVAGGVAADVAAAILSKKSPGCAYTGSTTVTVQDTVGYSVPYPSYDVKFQIAAGLVIKFAVDMANSAAVPSDATTQVQQAVLAAFAGEDGGPRARIGATLFASRFYAAVAALGAWAQIINIKVGASVANLDEVLVDVAHIPTLTQADIVVNFA